MRPALFSTLDPREARRLETQLLTYVRDYPRMPAEDLAEIWHDEQEVLGEGTWIAPYLEGRTWSREVPRAISYLRVMAARKERAREARRASKDRMWDRVPATDRQVSYLKRVAERHPGWLPVDPAMLSKLQARQLITEAMAGAPRQATRA